MVQTELRLSRGQFCSEVGDRSEKRWDEWIRLVERCTLHTGHNSETTATGRRWERWISGRMDGEKGQPKRVKHDLTFRMAGLRIRQAKVVVARGGSCWQLEPSELSCCKCTKVQMLRLLPATGCWLLP
jgi:hypothetical protein